MAGKLGIPFFALNFKADFDRIIDYFADEYVHGPDAQPLRRLQRAPGQVRPLSPTTAVPPAPRSATGHYARIELRDGRHRLIRAADTRKDQSYVLFGIDRDSLTRTLFPIGHMTKNEVRDEARRRGLPVSEKPGSPWNICFVPDRDYGRVVRRPARRPSPKARCSGRRRQRGRPPRRRCSLHHRPAPGPGHRPRPAGLCHQNRPNHQHHHARLQGKPGPRHADRRPRALAHRRPHGPVLRERPNPLRPPRRRRHRGTACRADELPGGVPSQARVQVKFDQPQSAIAPGQAAVIYDADTVLGGGWI